MNFFIMLLSLLASTIASVLVLKKRNNKWLSLISAFCINTLILVVTPWVLYSFDEEVRVFGYGYHFSHFVLIQSIPIITLINFLILEFVRSRRITIKD